MVNKKLKKEEIKTPWDQREGEPDEAYRMFNTYYIPLGLTRSIRKAYFTHMGIEKPGMVVGSYGDSEITNPSKWTKWAEEYEWLARAREYDSWFMAQSLLIVEDAKRTLMNAAPDAVKALIESLGNSRYKVSAAKAIFDRIGLPATSQIKHGEMEKFTGDEYAEAAEEVEKWEKRFEHPKKNDADKNG